MNALSKKCYLFFVHFLKYKYNNQNYIHTIIKLWWKVTNNIPFTSILISVLSKTITQTSQTRAQPEEDKGAEALSQVKVEKI